VDSRNVKQRSSSILSCLYAAARVQCHWQDTELSTYIDFGFWHCVRFILLARWLPEANDTAWDRWTYEILKLF
jgi:hypothetical protein